MYLPCSVWTAPMLKNVSVEKKHSLSLHWWLRHTQQKATHIKAAAGVRKKESSKEGRKEGQKEAWSDGWKDRHDGSMEAQRCQGPVVLLALQLCWLMRGFLQAPSLLTQKKHKKEQRQQWEQMRRPAESVFTMMQSHNRYCQKRAGRRHLKETHRYTYRYAEARVSVTP